MIDGAIYYSRIFFGLGSNVYMSVFGRQDIKKEKTEIECMEDERNEMCE